MRRRRQKARAPSSLCCFRQNTVPRRVRGTLTSGGYLRGIWWRLNNVAGLSWPPPPCRRRQPTPPPHPALAVAAPAVASAVRTGRRHRSHPRRHRRRRRACNYGRVVSVAAACRHGAHSSHGATPGGARRGASRARTRGWCPRRRASPDGALSRAAPGTAGCRSRAAPRADAADLRLLPLIAATSLPASAGAKSTVADRRADGGVGGRAATATRPCGGGTPSPTPVGQS